MLREKSVGIRRLIKLILLLSVPAGAVISVRHLPELKAVFRELTDEPQAVSEKDEAPTIPRDEDKLSGKLILSEGFGTSEEKAEDDEDGFDDPFDDISDAPGEKPYPAEDEWIPGGDIIRTTYGIFSGETYFDLENGGQVSNRTEVPDETLLAESRCLPNFTLTDTDEPQVLIYHTHTTESFEPYVREHYDAEFNYRTTDETKNIVMVGDAVQAELEAAGIGVIHARDIHDYPSYNGSYSRSRETVLAILEQYPSIKVALDIHRDAISGEGTAYQPYIDIDGREAAQIMIISGCDDGTLGMPDYMKNFHFACSLQQQLEADFPGITRPILFDYRQYNQDLTTGSLLIEIGSHGNTLAQAKYSGMLFGRSLASLLNKRKG